MTASILPQPGGRVRRPVTFSQYLAEAFGPTMLCKSCGRDMPIEFNVFTDLDDQQALLTACCPCQLGNKTLRGLLDGRSSALSKWNAIRTIQLECAGLRFDQAVYHGRLVYPLTPLTLAHIARILHFRMEMRGWIDLTPARSSLALGEHPDVPEIGFPLNSEEEELLDHIASVLLYSPISVGEMGERYRAGEAALLSSKHRRRVA